MILFEAARALCSQQGLDKTYWIAYSGGLDSHVLLHVFASMRAKMPLRLCAVHVNHGLSPHARQWSEHCAKVCAELAVDLKQVNLSLDLRVGDSLEEVARQQRYASLAQVMQSGDILLTAHHQDDQAETLLLQLLRGAGPKGLAAMPRIKPFYVGWHARPFLNIERAQLAEYADAASLSWVDDESNSNTNIARNFVRHEVMPLLKNRWPAATDALARSAAHCAETHSLLAAFAHDECYRLRGQHSHTLSVAKLRQLDPAQQRLILRTWIEARQYPMPSTVKLETIRQDLLYAGADRVPCVEWCDVAIRRFRDDLFLQKRMSPHDVSTEFKWQLVMPLQLNQSGKLAATLSPQADLRADISELIVRFRQGGEKIRIEKRCHRTLKNLWQEWGVPTWLRDRIPLLHDQNRLVCIPGYYTDPDYAAEKNGIGWKLEWSID